jgi:gliding motility-associated lipoprotein GldD
MNKIFAFKMWFSIVVIGFLFVGCKDDVIPKPASQLRLEYPTASYISFENNCPFRFQMNDAATVKDDGNCGFSITYPKMKATIYLTYKSVNGDIDKLTIKETLQVRLQKIECKF